MTPSRLSNVKIITFPQLFGLQAARMYTVSMKGLETHIPESDELLHTVTGTTVNSK